MEATFASCSVFRERISPLLELLDSVRFLISEKEGFVIQEMEDSFVSMVRFHMLPKACSHFKVDNPNEVLELGINLKVFCTILMCGTGNEELFLKYDPKEPDDIQIRIFSSKRNAEFKLKLMTNTKERLQIPDNTCRAHMRVNSKRLEVYIKQMKTFSDELYIMVSRKGLRLSLEEGDTKATIYMKPAKLILDGKETLFSEDMQDADTLTFLSINQLQTDESDFEIEKMEYQDKFSLKYILKFMKSNTHCDTVDLYFFQDLPMLVRFVFQNEKGEKEGVLDFYLAHKV